MIADLPFTSLKEGNVIRIKRRPSGCSRNDWACLKQSVVARRQTDSCYVHPLFIMSAYSKIKTRLQLLEEEGLYANLWTSHGYEWARLPGRLRLFTPDEEDKWTFVRLGIASWPTFNILVWKIFRWLCASRLQFNVINCWTSGNVCKRCYC